MNEPVLSARDLNTLALVGCYVPRQCGIATFTKDLRDALTEETTGDVVRVLAMDDVPDSRHYSEEVGFQIRAECHKDYLVAADLLNINQIDIAVIQHEFGIYGGRDGAMLLELLRRLRMPIICTLHTVLMEPTDSQARIMNELARRCDRLVVMCHLAEQILREVFAVPNHKIAYIPHGIHETAFVDSSFHKDQYGLEGRTVLLTSGLLSPGKGIEHIIDALPRVVKERPDVMYVVLGATHPHVVAREGEAYRRALEEKVNRLRLHDHVVFHNQFVSLEDFCGYIGASDLYATPYLNAAQITSGTLAYAMGAGKAVVSTPYLYAREMLADNRGMLVPFGDSRAIADTVSYLLANEVERSAMRKRAYLHCRPMVWNEVAASYLRLAREVLEERMHKPHTAFTLRSQAPRFDSIPEIDLRHLRSLTDDTGLLQHAVYTVADRYHGYTTDDNVRALALALQYYDLRKDATALPLANTYLAFTYGAFNEDAGRFRNFMSYDRRWQDDVGSEDVHGRALVALGLAAALAPNEGMLAFSTRLFNRALAAPTSFLSPRGWSFALIGIHAYLSRFSGDVRARNMRKILADNLYNQFLDNASPDWPWPEDRLTYANARLPHALILSGQWIPNNDMLRQGLASLEWLLDIQTTPSGSLSLIGNQGWCTRDGSRAHFDQQPIEIMGLIEACAEAYLCTRERAWIQHARRCFSWFLGNNDTQSVLYDFKTGGCRDGLQSDGPNQNEGAESTLAWLLSLIKMHQLLKEEKRELAMPAAIFDTGLQPLHLAGRI